MVTLCRRKLYTLAVEVADEELGCPYLNIFIFYSIMKGIKTESLLRGLVQPKLQPEDLC